MTKKPAIGGWGVLEHAVELARLFETDAEKTSSAGSTT